MHRRQLKLIEPCQNDWKAMQGTSMVRHCTSCAKNVYDLSMLTEREAEAALAVRPENVCVRYRVDARGKVIFYPDAPASLRYSRPRNAIAAALTVTAMAACPPGPIALAQDAKATATAEDAAAEAPKKAEAKHKKKDGKRSASEEGKSCAPDWEATFGKNRAAAARMARDGDLLLMGGLSSAPTRNEPPPSRPSGLPDVPGREDVVSAFQRIEPAIHACGGGPGVAFVDVNIKGASGKVANVQVTNVAPGPAACMEKALRALVVPKFWQASFKVKYPYKLRG